MRVDPFTADCARRLKVLADPTRLEVAERLLAGPCAVSELQGVLGVEASLLSHHLRVLREAGLVDAVREGRAVSYRLADSVRKAGDDRLDLGCCSIDFQRSAAARRRGR